MSREIQRNYLEINSIKELKESKFFEEKYSIENVEPANFQINKFFYKNIGKNHQWVDRLIWDDKRWIDYTEDKKVKTYVLKNVDDLAGYFELILHHEKNEIERTFRRNKIR